MSPRIAPLLVLLTAIAAGALAACSPQAAAAPQPTAAPPSTATPRATATQKPKPTATRPPPTATPPPPTATVPPPTATPEPTPEVEVEAGWLLHAQPAEGFSVALPDTWQHYSADRASLLKGFGAIRRQHPQLSPLYNDRQCDCLYKAGWRLFAFDSAPESSGDSYPATLILYKFSGLDDPYIEDVVSWRLEQILASGRLVHPVANDAIDSQAGSGARLWYLTNGMIDEVTRLPLFNAEYLLVKGSDVYYMVLTTSIDQQAHYAPLLDKILRSFDAVETGSLEGTV
jgi:hypothetical protein